MFKGKAELNNEKDALVADFNETCHEYGATTVTVKLCPPLAPFNLKGTESLAIFAKCNSQPVIFVEASDPAGTEIREFHGRSAIGCVPDGTGLGAGEEPRRRSRHPSHRPWDGDS
jgi:hypothetical protein